MSYTISSRSSLPTSRRWQSNAPPGVHRPASCDVSNPLLRQSFRNSSSISSQSVARSVAEAIVTYERDPKGIERVKYDPSGWNFWQWTGPDGQPYRIHYLQAGEQGPPIVLVHGYGASAYHWRYNIPALARSHRVYAIDMLGFGWSTKAHVDYSNGRVWVQQISDFIREVVGGGPVVLAGNSLGGFASLATAAAHPEQVKALALLNSAGPFEEPSKPTGAQPALYQPLVDALVRLVKRVVLFFAFQRARQPGRIQEVLSLVYANKDNIDDDLVQSIVAPAKDPAAAETFFLINDQRGPSVTVDSLLRKLDMDVLLLWGDLDPWIVPSRAAKILSLYPRAKKVSLQSGHCPHDDTPLEANQALLQWLAELEAKPAAL